MRHGNSVNYIPATPALVEAIRARAHRVHDDVNQRYDTVLPYGYHLDCVARVVERYIDEVLVDEAHRVPVMFGAYFHDTIEDARLTYNNVVSVAEEFMTAAQAAMAAEIVYALTNEKGRTRAERANGRYYSGIRATPYAPMVKLADRIANLGYSVGHAGGVNEGMLAVYRGELPHFIKSITVGEDVADRRLTLPVAMVTELRALANGGPDGA